MSFAGRLRAWIAAGLADPQQQDNASTDRTIILLASLDHLLAAVGSEDLIDPYMRPRTPETYLVLVPIIAALLKRLQELEDRVDEEAYKTKKHETELFGE